MKRILTITLSLMLVLSLSVFAAAVSYDLFTYRDGNTYLETFILSIEDEQTQSEWREFVTGSNTVICSLDEISSVTGDFVYFFTSDNLSEFSVIANDDYTCNIYADSVSGFGGQVYEYNGNGEFNFYSYYNGSPDTHIENAVILGGLGVDTMNHIEKSSSYIADVEGDLYIVDDLGESDESESDGVLGFLGDFWNKFKTFLTSLFIPSDGYFADWYNEIKAAFDEKFGALTELYNQLTGFFDGIESDETPSELFDDAYFGDILSLCRGIITGLILLLTMIFCYRKIISLISE